MNRDCECGLPNEEDVEPGEPHCRCAELLPSGPVLDPWEERDLMRELDEILG